MKSAKKCAYNPSVSNEEFLNALLEPYVFAGGVVAKGGTAFRLDKHRTSKILSGQADVPLALRKVSLQHGLERRVSEGCAILWDETLNPMYFGEFKKDIASLIDGEDPLQKALGEKLCVKEEDPDAYLACLLIGVIGLKNRPETQGVIWRKGTGSFSWLVGDLFRFGFNSRKKAKNLVVVPVDCSFETHVTRDYEGLEVKRVSENTVHGKWLIRMAQSGVLEPELKERISYELRGVARDSEGCCPVGTVAAIETPKSVFLLLAVSKFDSNGNAKSGPEDISRALDCLLGYYDRLGQGADMYMPLIGTGLSRSGLDVRESFGMIVDAVTRGASFVGGKVVLVLLPEVAAELGLIK